jgi:hypothetical protein
MTETETRHLRVLIANEKRERLELLAQVVVGLGHEVIAREIYVKEVGAVTARERPDVALVGLGLHSEHALELISVADPPSSGSAPRPSSPISGPSRARIPSSAGFWSAGPAEHSRWSSSTAIQSFCARH